MDAFGAYAGLFAASFLAATVLPFQSEVMLVASGPCCLPGCRFWATL
jgi:membrane protein YqaA with SNARE-associated domain